MVAAHRSAASFTLCFQLRNECRRMRLVTLRTQRHLHGLERRIRLPVYERVHRFSLHEIHQRNMLRPFATVSKQRHMRAAQHASLRGRSPNGMSMPGRLRWCLVRTRLVPEIKLSEQRHVPATGQWSSGVRVRAELVGRRLPVRRERMRSESNEHLPQ